MGCGSRAQHPIPIYLIVLTQTLSGLTQLSKVGTAVLKLEGRDLRLRGGLPMPIPGELEIFQATIATRQGGGAIARANPSPVVGSQTPAMMPTRGGEAQCRAR